MRFKHSSTFSRIILPDQKSVLKNNYGFCIIILIVLDLSIPLDLDAIDILDQFRTQWRAIVSTTPPIIVLTTFEKIYNDLSAKGESVLRKPFHVNDLFFAMSKLLSPSLGKKSI